ncbi:hypothetical protein [Pseudomonas sp. CC6-YY-74]|uniref:hypothetical protein n=1 Tax=Pseudomonas sp. CC6-YY-74 TaxID=1930532 RepID=UPI0009A248F7|nr:hypothetical protein [Pseudomonas sp. CC6-YY-74]
MLVRSLLAVVLVSLAGCSTVKPKELTGTEADQLQGKTLGYSRYSELPDFIAQTAVNVQFGLLGVAAAVSNGNSMIRDNKIEDPALGMAKQLADELAAAQKMTIVHAPTAVESADLDAVVAAYPQFDYILDVRTRGWSSIYYVSDFNNYKVAYSVYARLIDRKTKRVLAEKACSYTPIYEDTNKAPSYHELEQGVGLRSQLVQSVDYCSDDFRKIMGLNLPAALAKTSK